jgi:hypothetical protein
MPILDVQPERISEAESKVLATRQMLSFLTVSSAESSERAPSKALFSLDALPDNGFTDGPELFNWTSRDIYDVDDRLLLRHHTIDLGSGNEWAVSVAATNLLRTPVWRVKAGPKLNEEALVNNALRALEDNPDLKPIFVEGEEQIRLITHSYPRLGLLCQSTTNPDVKSVIDIGDLTIIPLTSRPKENMESANAVWSPYDIVVSSTFAHFRLLWNRNLDSLPQLPQPQATRKAIEAAIEKARQLVVEEKTTNPELRLSPQQTDYYCAAATAQMILRHYHFCKTQEEIAKEMNISASGGADPNDQVAGIALLTGKALEAKLDLSTSFCEAREEIRQNRPLKTSGPIHARACGGFKVETEDRNWLYLYNPWPSNQGSVYFEAWDANRHNSYMYVRPFLPS